MPQIPAQLSIPSLHGSLRALSATEEGYKDVRKLYNSVKEPLSAAIGNIQLREHSDISLRSNLQTISRNLEGVFHYLDDLFGAGGSRRSMFLNTFLGMESSSISDLETYVGAFVDDKYNMASSTFSHLDQAFSKLKFGNLPIEVKKIYKQLQALCINLRNLMQQFKERVQVILDQPKLSRANHFFPR